MTHRNCLSHWFPLVQATGVPVPETRIVHAPKDLAEILDKKMPSGWNGFADQMRAAIAEIGGTPCFLRTGQTSNKHRWKDTCFLADLDLLPHHVGELLDFSALCDFMGLPSDVWVVRRLIKTAPLFTAFKGLPVTREFRLFVDSGEVQCVHPYWPESAVEEGCPTDPEWRHKLLVASNLMPDEMLDMTDLARRASKSLPGAWSIDVLQDADGKWWVTDCADAGCSFHWAGCPNNGRWERRYFVEDVPA